MAKSKSKNKKKTKKNSNYKNEKIEYKVPPKKKYGKVMTEKQKLREERKAEKKRNKASEKKEKQDLKSSKNEKKEASKEISDKKLKTSKKAQLPDKVIIQPEKDEKTGKIEAKETEVVFVPMSGGFIETEKDKNDMPENQEESSLISGTEENVQSADPIVQNESDLFFDEKEDKENTVDSVIDAGGEKQNQAVLVAEPAVHKTAHEKTDASAYKNAEKNSDGQAENKIKIKEKNNSKRNSAFRKTEIKEISIDELMEVHQYEEDHVKNKKVNQINYKEKIAYLKKKYAKKIKPAHYIIAAAALVTLVGLIYGLIGMLNSAEPAAIRNINYTGRNQPQGSVVSITSSEEDQKNLSKNTESKGSKKFDFFAYTEMTVDKTDSPLSITLGNPSYNDCVLIATILNEKGETVYRTSGIEPGSYISSITLANTLVYGENKLTLYVTAFDGDGGKDGKTYRKFGTRSAELLIHVGSAYNESMLAAD